MREWNGIKKRKDYLCIQREGKKIITNGVIVLYKNRMSDLQPQKLQPRFGITVSKSIGKAVMRNHIKRRIRSALDFIHHGGHTSKDCDYVIIARKNAVDMCFKKLLDNLLYALNKLGPDHNI